MKLDNILKGYFEKNLDCIINRLDQREQVDIARIVRRVPFMPLMSNELVSIQPMSLPTGLLFYLDYVYKGSEGIT